MKTSSIWKFRAIAGKVMMGLALAAMVGSVNVLPAYGDDHQRLGKHDKGRYEHRGRGYDKRRYMHREGGYNYYQPYGYSERVYAPVYAPPPEPGISIFSQFIAKGFASRRLPSFQAELIWAAVASNAVCCERTIGKKMPGDGDIQCSLSIYLQTSAYSL